MGNRPSPDHAGRRSADAPDGLTDLAWELPHRFLGLDDHAASWDRAGAVVLPVPYEATTSWGGGTRNGPSALIEASRYIELYDHELQAEPHEAGIHTLPALELTRAGPEAAMEELEDAYRRLIEVLDGRFPVMLGGEHSISAPPIRAWADALGERVCVLQMDAHADLRASYEGTGASHASAMARVLGHADVVGVGIRGISAEEVQVAAAEPGVHLIYADNMWQDDAWMDEALERLHDPVYLTFDVDYLDPSLMPSTGTPEPGGGEWYRTLRFLRRVFRERKVVAMDLVELAPLPGVFAPDFLAAKLVYKLIGYRFEAD